MPRQLPLLERYRDLLARPGEAFPISLGEGGTPLVHAARLGAELGLDALHLKFEGTNPTGSFKDRGMVLAVNRAVASGAQAVVCASTGNTAASAAAYAAAAGLPCHVVLPAGKVARGKLAQALAAGARLIIVDGNFDQALAAVRALGDEGSGAVVNSINPDRIAGQQTGAFEIVDELGQAPDAVALPVGNAGNITAYWAGFVRYAASGRTEGAAAADAGLPGRGRRTDRARRAGRVAGDGRDGHPHRESSLLGRRRWPPVTSLVASSKPSATRRSSTCSCGSPAARASSASRPPPPAWRGCARLAA